jgi:hypothetical protein
MIKRTLDFGLQTSDVTLAPSGVGLRASGPAIYIAK